MTGIDRLLIRCFDCFLGTYTYLFSPSFFSINRVIVIERALIEQVAFVTGTTASRNSLHRACHLNQSAMHVKQPLNDLQFVR